jgi:hypothetical protein
VCALVLSVRKLNHVFLVSDHAPGGRYGQGGKKKGGQIVRLILIYNRSAHTVRRDYLYGHASARVRCFRLFPAFAHPSDFYKPDQPHVRTL